MVEIPIVVRWVGTKKIPYVYSMDGSGRKTAALAQMVRNDEILRLYAVWLLWPKVSLVAAVTNAAFVLKGTMDH